MRHREPSGRLDIVNSTFADVLQALESIAATASTIGKQELIAKYAKDSLFCTVVELALDPYRRFKMSGNIKLTPEPEQPLESFVGTGKIIERLCEFSAKASLTKEDKRQFADLVRAGGLSAVDVVNRILNKDLCCGASVLTFRKASNRFVSLPVHHPMKGGDDLQKFLKHAGSRLNICWSYKLDGTRTWAIVDWYTKKVTYLSSNGHELQNFRVFDERLIQVAQEISEKGSDGVWRRLFFDGEVVNVQGDFSKHMSQFRRLKEMDASGFRFRIFDMLLNMELYNTPNALSGALFVRDFHTRYMALQSAESLPLWLPGDTDSLCSLLEHQTLSDSPKRLARIAVDKHGLEGIMLKTWNHEYQCKRSSDWCKIKFFHTEDLPVVATIEGTGKYKGCLGALVVERNGIRIEVGSGYTDAERKEFWSNPPRCIEVKYQDSLVSGSLRFPVFVRVRDDKEV